MDCLGLFRSSLCETKGRTRKRGTVQLARTRDTPRAKQSCTQNFHRTSHRAHQHFPEGLREMHGGVYTTERVLQLVVSAGALQLSFAATALSKTAALQAVGFIQMEAWRELGVGNEDR
eukprot:scaffold43140_cov62-Phaeocystis_antarctica.AAC.5